MSQLSRQQRRAAERRALKDACQAQRGLAPPQAERFVERQAARRGRRAADELLQEWAALSAAMGQILGKRR